MLDDVCRLTPREVKAALDQGEQLLILDVRQPGDYDASSLTIPGARRVDPGDLGSAISGLPLGARIVTFCT